MKKKFKIIVVILAILQFNTVSYIQAVSNNSEITDHHANNITFTDPCWTMYKTSTSYLSNTVKLMKDANIKYQMIDLGFFDKDYDSGNFILPISGSMDTAPTNYLNRYLEITKDIAPEIKNIGLFNGSGLYQIMAEGDAVYTPIVSKDEMHKKIVDYIVEVVNTYDLDGVNLDFEPMRSNYIKSYVELTEKIRAGIGEDKMIFICGPLEAADSVVNFSEYVDVYISMDYDTGITDENGYINYVAKNVAKISQLLSETDMKYIPLAPGVYGDNEYHISTVESTRAHSIAVANAIELYGIKVFGSGVWWWKGTIDNMNEYYDFLDYWVQ